MSTAGILTALPLPIAAVSSVPLIFDSTLGRRRKGIIDGGRCVKKIADHDCIICYCQLGDGRFGNSTPTFWFSSR
jgi:hypothetical protein